MATWEDQTLDRKGARTAPPIAGLVALAAVLALSAGTFAASRLMVTRGTAIPATPPAAVITGPLLPAVSSAPAPPAPQFVIVFGEFASPARANAYARKVRSKGYLASVLRSDASFRVISRPFESREVAQFWTGVFEEIGLNAEETTELEDRG